MVLFFQTLEHEGLRFFLESNGCEMICEVLTEVFIVVCLFRALLKLASPAAQSTTDAASQRKPKHDFSSISTIPASKNLDVTASHPEKSMHGNFCRETSTQVCGSRALGRVKSYSAAHGYGFLVCSNLEEDIFFAEESVPIDDLRHLRIGSGVTFTLSKCPQKTRLRANSLNLTFSGVVRWHHHANMYAFITCVDSRVEGDVSFSHGDLVNKTDVILPGSVAHFQMYWNVSSGRFRARQVQLSGFPADRPTLEDHAGDSAVKCCHIDQVLTDAAGACKKPGERAIRAPSSAGRGEMSASNDPTSGASARPTEMTTQQGIVKSFNAARGYGFVQVSGMSQDIWFAAACVGGEPVTVGTHVQTEVFMVEVGKYRAHWVRRCDLY
eukprot:CAMPEP_0194493114 /NCGR_PEP_ID=MMETSP0253-20130528/11429_1 /TAXON_ID=2966 /ORGANISM="Noctiluca scintillans" /LENGTH=381 /DNA_ID=CAMNT_0039334053 /DNA_START=18 /DNA_END=1163 /DNA_ORIENTATION=-